MSASREAAMHAQAASDSSRPTAIDLFSGAGGATQGLVDAGFSVIGAVEFDSIASESYRLNHPSVRLWEQDIRGIRATTIARDLELKPGELGLLKACPPCQGFSTLAEGRINGDDPRNELVRHTIRFVRVLRPKAVLIENVPGLGRDRRSAELLDSLRRMGYNARVYHVNAVDFGVPQKRKRLIILALRGLRAALPETLTPADPEEPRTVRQAFDQLASEVDPNDPLSVPRALPAAVLRRVEAIPAGGNRYDLPPDLQLDCHKKLADEGKSGASGSYARLRWEDPAPTMTTRCTTPACGPFLHPELHRPLTLREAAVIQTFPASYQFAGRRGDIERQIGNAVPVKMAAAIAGHLLDAIQGREGLPEMSSETSSKKTTLVGGELR